MFDDLQKKQTGVDDIFADTDPGADGNVVANNQMPSGLGAQPVSPYPQAPLAQQPPMTSVPGANLGGPVAGPGSFGGGEKKGGGILKKIFILIIVLALIGAGAYFVYSQVLLPKADPNNDLLGENMIVVENGLVGNQEEINIIPNTNIDLDDELEMNDFDNLDFAENQEIGNDDQFFDDDFFGEDISGEGTFVEFVDDEDQFEVLKNLDSDNDGISDYDELYVYKTNPYNIDTDGDDLSDYEEIFIIGTDPLNPDTDGDTHPDGGEIANGYNPLGDGEIDFSLFKDLELFKEHFPDIAAKFEL